MTDIVTGRGVVAHKEDDHEVHARQAAVQAALRQGGSGPHLVLDQGMAGGEGAPVIQTTVPEAGVRAVHADDRNRNGAPLPESTGNYRFSAAQNRKFGM
jgi:hypothetical protein